MLFFYILIFLGENHITMFLGLNSYHKEFNLGENAERFSNCLCAFKQH